MNEEYLYFKKINYHQEVTEEEIKGFCNSLDQHCPMRNVMKDTYLLLIFQQPHFRKHKKKQVKLF